MGEYADNMWPSSFASDYENIDSLECFPPTTLGLVPLQSATKVNDLDSEMTISSNATAVRY